MASLTRTALRFIRTGYIGSATRLQNITHRSFSTGQRKLTFHQRTLSLVYFGKYAARPLTTTSKLSNTIDPDEMKNFDSYAQELWSERGEYELLHLMNTLRVPFMVEGITNSKSFRGQSLQGKTILDVGCGGGILSEPLARLGANVTGIDASASSIEVAKLHAKNDPSLNQKLEYSCKDVLDLQGKKFDALVASEVVEHVADLDLFLDGCCRLVKPGGSIFLTTMNRTRLAQLLTITMAENVLGIVPKGMHNWSKYVKPSELKEKLASRGFSTVDTRGMFYNPLLKQWSWQDDLNVNYALHAVNMEIDFSDQDDGSDRD